MICKYWLQEASSLERWAGISFPIKVFNLSPATGGWLLWIILFFCSVTKLCPTVCNPMDCSSPGSSVLRCLPDFAQIHFHELVMLSNYLIFHCPLLLLTPIFHRIRVFSNESALRIRWPKVLELQLQHQFFQFRIDFLWDWLVWSPCSPRTLKSLL